MKNVNKIIKSKSKSG